MVVVRIQKDNMQNILQTLDNDVVTGKLRERERTLSHGRDKERLWEGGDP